MMRKLKSLILACVAICSLGSLAAFGASSALAAQAPRWDVINRVAPTNLKPGEKGQVVGVLINLGDAPVLATEGSPVTITDTLPKGCKATKAIIGYAARGNNEDGRFSEYPLECAPLPELRCKYVGLLPPFVAIE